MRVHQADEQMDTILASQSLRFVYSKVCFEQRHVCRYRISFSINIFAHSYNRAGVKLIVRLFVQ